MFWRIDEESSPCHGLQSRNEDRIAVRIPNLVTIPEGSDLFIDSITSGHFAVNFAQDPVRDRTQLTAFFYDLVFDEKIRLNAASLRFGGLYEEYAQCSSLR